MATILVTGGTGTLGRPVVGLLRADGHEVRVLSRRGPEHAVDLSVGGPALGAALTGVDTVVHCASSPRGGDETAARHLFDAARAAGVGHVVYISIVGVDRVPYGYYRSKLAVERMLEDSGLGWTVLRATQFHELVAQFMATLAKSPLMPVLSGVRDQPVEVTEVAARLAELASGEPSGRVADMGGPEVRTFESLARAYLRARGKRRLLVPVRLGGAAYRAFRAGGHLAPEHAVGKGTFESYLRTRQP
ncbi:NAD(P)H-binding protein [Streptomyces roseirectus]|uniref:NAD(P)H-binding protein n=1 Tax=Streptomyces roseirectus TaxID=2768066 RepID=A0A7H0IM49_9ACTN|nr:NAD(P)H-binding protein [Streptomyces roseirectus]QNP73865.1 NAD(P)H-binding protein [Streptomyces roseirectus]